MGLVRPGLKKRKQPVPLTEESPKLTTFREKAKSRRILSQDVEETPVVTNLPPTKHPARVKISRGLTLKLPDDYEMMRIDVSLELPCRPEDVDATLIKCLNFVDAQLEKESKEVFALRQKD